MPLRGPEISGKSQMPDMPSADLPLQHPCNQTPKNTEQESFDEWWVGGFSVQPSVCLKQSFGAQFQFRWGYCRPGWHWWLARERHGDEEGANYIYRSPKITYKGPDTCATSWYLWKLKKKKNEVGDRLWTLSYSRESQMHHLPIFHCFIIGILGKPCNITASILDLLDLPIPLMKTRSPLPMHYTA